MRNPCAIVDLNGGSRSAHGVDMNPLAVFGRLGKLIDARLWNVDPVADGDFLADPIPQR